MGRSILSISNPIPSIFQTFSTSLFKLSTSCSGERVTIDELAIIATQAKIVTQIFFGIFVFWQTNRRRKIKRQRR